MLMSRRLKVSIVKLPDNLSCVHSQHAEEERLKLTISYLSLKSATQEEQITQSHRHTVCMCVSEPIQPVSVLVLLLVWQHEQTAVGRTTGGAGFRGFPFQTATKAAASTKKPHSQ